MNEHHKILYENAGRSNKVWIVKENEKQVWMK